MLEKCKQSHTENLQKHESGSKIQFLIHIWIIFKIGSISK